jgi:hypothetical protein
MVEVIDFGSATGVVKKCRHLKVLVSERKCAAECLNCRAVLNPATLVLDYSSRLAESVREVTRLQAENRAREQTIIQQGVALDEIAEMLRQTRRDCEVFLAEVSRFLEGE